MQACTRTHRARYMHKSARARMHARSHETCATPFGSWHPQVMRSTADGVEMMRDYPDVDEYPGVEDWLPAEKWSRDRVFHDMEHR
eukprot:6196755-Pleurochrysis_carterae.AAC.1